MKKIKGIARLLKTKEYNQVTYWSSRFHDNKQRLHDAFEVALDLLVDYDALQFFHDIPCFLPGYPSGLIPAEQVSCIHLPHHIVQAAVIPVGDDGLAHLLELLQVIDHPAAKECSYRPPEWARR